MDIHEAVKIFEEELYWKGKLLVFTWHFKEEFDRLRKPLEFVLIILDKGEHVLVGRKQRKYNVFYPYGKGHLCLSYVEHEGIILIHIKPVRRKR